MLVPAGAIIAQFMQTMQEFPPRQSPETWTPGAMLENMRKRAEALKAAAHPG
jgi:arylsulfatase